MYRPDNWEEIKRSILPLRMESLDPFPFQCVEAGAEAMHKADVEWIKQHLEECDEGYEGYKCLELEKEWNAFKK